MQEAGQWGVVNVREEILELPGAVEAKSLFQEGYPDNRMTVRPQ